MAENQLRTTLTPNFAEQSTGGISIEPDYIPKIDFSTPLLVFPPEVDRLQADVGTITVEGNKVVPVPAGILSFNGSTATLPKRPSAKGTRLRVLFAFDPKTGSSLSVSVSYDADGVVKANKAFVGVVSYTAYETYGKMISYFPLYESDPTGGVRVVYGVIAAFRKPNHIAIYQTHPPAVDDGNVEIELYRRVSYAVTTQEGEFELPTNYPTSGAYTNPSASLVLDVSTSMKTQRVHEIGYMDLRGRGRVANYTVPIRPPFDINSPNYAPKIEYIEAKIPTATPNGAPIPFNFQFLASNFIRSKGYGKK